MFAHKYIAINTLYGTEVKRFRTQLGVKRWLKKRSFFSLLLTKVYSIEDLIESDHEAALVNEQLDAFQLMRRYAEADVEATSQMYQGMSPTQGVLDEVQDYDIDDRCGKTDCLWCYGTQKEYEQGYFDEVTAPSMWCELCQVDHSKDGFIPYDQRGDEEPTLPGLEQPMPHWERELLGSLDSEPGQPPIYCPNDCEYCDAKKAEREAQAIAEAESNDAIRTLRAILGNVEVIEEEPEVVLIACHEYGPAFFDIEVPDLTGDDRTELVMENEQLFRVLIDLNHFESTAFYQLTPAAVEALGDFEPVIIETPEEFNDKLVLQQAREYYQGLAAGPSQQQIQDEHDEYVKLNARRTIEILPVAAEQRWQELHPKNCLQCHERRQEFEATKAAETNGVNPSV